MVATIWVLVTDEGVIVGLAPRFTVAPLAKPVPVRVRVNAAPPAVALVGESDVRPGDEPVTANVTEALVPPPGAGFVTVTGKLPTVKRSAANIEAVSFVALTKVVLLAVPLKFTTEPFTKLLPFTVSVKAAPLNVALVGEIVVIVGAGLLLLMVNVCAPVVPPPGVGFLTVTLTGPTVAS